MIDGIVLDNLPLTKYLDHKEFGIGLRCQNVLLFRLSLLKTCANDSFVFPCHVI